MFTLGYLFYVKAKIEVSVSNQLQLSCLIKFVSFSFWVFRWLVNLLRVVLLLWYQSIKIWQHWCSWTSSSTFFVLSRPRVDAYLETCISYSCWLWNRKNREVRSLLHSLRMNSELSQKIENLDDMKSVPKEVEPGMYFKFKGLQ